jgi:hypothetical protein
MSNETTLLEDVEAERTAKRWEVLLDEIAELRQTKPRRPAEAEFPGAEFSPCPPFGPLAWMDR